MSPPPTPPPPYQMRHHDLQICGRMEESLDTADREGAGCLLCLFPADIWPRAARSNNSACRPRPKFARVLTEGPTHRKWKHRPLRACLCLCIDCEAVARPDVGLGETLGIRGSVRARDEKNLSCYHFPPRVFNAVEFVISARIFQDDENTSLCF